jgi:soluble lytic murein transglycosylase
LKAAAIGHKVRSASRLILLTGLLLAAPGGIAAPAAEVAAAGPAELSREAREQFVRALAAFRAGEYREAARALGDPAWAGTPLREYALVYLAESWTRLGDTGAARAARLPLTEPAADGRLAPSALLQAGALAVAVGDDAAAAALYERFAVRHLDHPDAARARMAWGDALAATGRLQAAADVYYHLWLMMPAAPQANDAARHLRGLADRGISMPTPALAQRLERAERLLQGRSYQPAQSEAEALIGEALTAEQKDRAFRVSFEAARRPGQYEAANSIAQRALAALPSERRPHWLLEIARLHQRRGRDRTLAAIDRLVRQYPKSPQAAEALLIKAEILESVKRTVDARAVYVQLAKAHPEEPEGGAALWRLGWTAWFKAAHAEAAAMWGRMLQVRGAQAQREAAAYWFGRASEERGDRERAVRQYAQLVSDAPGTYYGVLAGRRTTTQLTASRPATPGMSLPADPLEPLKADGRYARIEALRAVGLGEMADEELDELTRRSRGDPRRLYAISAIWVQEARHHMALRILRRHFYGVARSGAESAPRAFWEMLYPMAWRTEVAAAAQRASVDPLLVAAVVREESAYDPRARSRVGARGLMQLMPDTARPLARARGLDFGDGELLDDPASNVEMGAAYFGGLLRDFGDPRLATAAYNAGPGRVREWWSARRGSDIEAWVEHIPYNETRGFVKRVMLSWEEYRRLYGQRPQDDREPAAR